MGIALGASAYLTKPIARQVLLDVLERLAGERGKTPDQPLRVLVVDDQPEALELISLALDGSRYRLIRATNGTDALELLARERPDVLIVDLMMAPVSGFDVIDAAAADPETRHIPIVVWTARDLTAEDIARLNGHVSARVSKRDFAGAGKDRFLRELERVTGETHGEGSTNVAR
jgi:CheY-like chemotaxis protein